ncbi:MAG: cytochrome d ubiquinol oxidase subunit II [Bacteroidetes bacterium]|nr:cytochrome d ubiquinol oxidase subunit II [Bacteroidota bacterium]MBL6942950.1 cytochrome d ubiquinol oxidase subunit II [Bacteroidales bacterium]
MFENLTYLTLQHYWWAVVALLGAILVFMLFVQGGQTLIYNLGKTDIQRKIIVNALGRKWDLTFTTLVTFGGAAFASFPLFYATSFSGAYWVWMIILFAFIFQAVSYEFRTKPNNFLGAKTYETFLFINGLLGTILLGIVVSTFFTGSDFSINNMNSSTWESPYKGLELIFNFTKFATYVNISLGLAIFFLSRVLASMYFMNSVDDKQLLDRVKKQLLLNAIPFLVFFLFFLISILLIDGFAYNLITKVVTMQENKYLLNFIEMPIVAIVFLVGVIGVLTGIIRGYFYYEKCGSIAIWITGPGTILTVFALLLVSGFNNTCFYPSTYDLQSSLTIENASSSKYTLTAMSYVSLLVPVVIAYIWYAWSALNKKKITKEEMENDSHAY